MTNPPPLFDRPALLTRRKRALSQGPATFLHEEAAFELKERLKDINRTFTEIAVVTGFAELWGDMFPGAKVVSDDDILPLELQSCDLIVHAMCLHQSNDPIGQLVQCQRSLRPDGLLLVAMLGGQTLHELRAALAEAEVAVSDGLSPRVNPMIDIRDAGALLQRSGFALPVADSDPRHVSYSSVMSLMHDLRAMGENNALNARDKRCPPRRLFAEMATLYPTQQDRVVATFELLYLTGWAPDASQPKPLMPGSANARLADALKTVELNENAEPVKTQGSEDT